MREPITISNGAFKAVVSLDWFLSAPITKIRKLCRLLLDWDAPENDAATMALQDWLTKTVVAQKAAVQAGEDAISAAHAAVVVAQAALFSYGSMKPPKRLKTNEEEALRSYREVLRDLKSARQNVDRAVKLQRIFAETVKENKGGKQNA